MNEFLSQEQFDVWQQFKTTGKIEYMVTFMQIERQREVNKVQEVEMGM